MAPENQLTNLRSRLMRGTDCQQWDLTCYVANKIPPDIVRILFTLLPSVDQLCFSLSCSYLYFQFHLYLESQHRRFPGLPPSGERQALCPRHRLERIPRIQLLLRLEDSRWKFCYQCWNLHLRSSGRRRVWPLSLFSHQQSCSECQLLHGRQYCMPHVGEVEVCPCLTITFRDKLHLMETIRSARDTFHSEKVYYYDGVLYHPASRYRSIWHDCTVTSHPFATAEIRTILWIPKQSKSLYVENKYKFSISRENAQSLPAEVKTPFMCPHDNPRKWLKQFFSEAGLTFSGWHTKLHIPVLCRIKLEKENEPGILEISVIRNLGRGRSSDRTWNHSCRG